MRPSSFKRALNQLTARPINSIRSHASVKTIPKQKESLMSASMLSVRPCLLTLALCAAAGSTHAAVINVPADFATIQAAVDAATEGDEIVVAPGTYAESVSWTGRGLTLRSSAGPAVTIIDGGDTQSVLSAGNISTSVVIDGFTITNGATNGGDGAGLVLTNVADGTIRNCIVSENVADNASGGGAYLNAGTYTVENTTFINNRISGGGSGGGLYIEASTVSITGGLFSGNRNPGGSGGGIEVLDESANVTITGVTFIDNSAEGGSGGAVDAVFGATLTVRSSTFTNNGIGEFTNTFGGAIQAGDGTLTVENSIFNGNGDSAISTGATGSITGSTFTENVAIGGSGAGISLTLIDQMFTISNSTFTGNIADGGSGAGILVSGNGGTGTATIVGCTFVDNSTPGGAGAGIRVDAASPTIDRCIFRGGLAEGGGGSAISVDGAGAAPVITSSLLIGTATTAGTIYTTSGAQPRFVNCTIIGSAGGPGNPGGVLYPDTGTTIFVINSILRDDGTGGDILVPSAPGTATITFSNVQGGFTGVGNINADPLFANVATGDYTLLSGSPSINAGNSALVPSGSTLDLAGNARISGSAVDQGAYEAAGLACDSIDFNNDTSLFDPTDIDAFLSVFSEGPCIPATATCNDIDFNNDTSLFDPCDIDSFLLVFSEGPCTLCGV